MTLGLLLVIFAPPIACLIIGYAIGRRHECQDCYNDGIRHGRDDLAKELRESQYLQGINALKRSEAE